MIQAEMCGKGRDRSGICSVCLPWLSASHVVGAPTTDAPLKAGRMAQRENKEQLIFQYVHQLVCDYAQDPEAFSL